MDNFFNSFFSTESVQPSNTTTSLNEKELITYLDAYETMYNHLKLDEFKSYAMEADEEDPFAGLGDDIDDSSFEDSFGGEDDSAFDGWDDDDGTDTEKKKAQALEVSRSDLLDDSFNLGSNIRRVIPKKIMNLRNILDTNINIVTNKIYASTYTNDLKYIKESYEQILDSVNSYLDIIDTKTFDDIFADYVSFLSLIDNVNEMYLKVTKAAVKSTQ